MRNFIIICAVTMFFFGFPDAGAAADIDVFPGSGTPFQDAIDDATAGDTLHLNAGTYPEAVVVTKRLTIIGDVDTFRNGGPGAVTIQGGCSAEAAINIQADGVRLRGLRVFGGSFFAINVEGRSHVSVRATFSGATCEGVEYGINVFNSTAVNVTRNFAQGYGDAGVYFGGIPAAADVRGFRNTSTGNHRGIIVEDCGLLGVRLKANVARANETGIFLHNADGVSLVRNRARDNQDFGIHLDPTSDRNVLIDNTLSGNATDVINDGRLNCGQDNTFATGNVPSCD
jgi:parallel beta-helix repeat protein